jgi:acyl carrier protein
VLYSSIASVFGSPGQGNYAAANAFLDGLAAARTSVGKPCLSINWGAWSGSGLAVDRGVTARAREAGFGLIDSHTGFQALEAALSAGLSQVIVFPVEWPRFLQRFSRGNRSPAYLTNFKEPGRTACAPLGDFQGERTAVPAIALLEPGGQAERRASFADQLAALPANQLRTLVIDQVRRDAAQVLGLKELDSVPTNKPLSELGLDSLMAVDLRNRLGDTLGRTLPATLIFDYPTVEALADYLARDVFGLGAPEPGTSRTPNALTGTSAVLDEIENLEDDEIDRLLEEWVSERDNRPGNE